jgi:hypothetical protein
VVLLGGLGDRSPSHSAFLARIDDEGSALRTAPDHRRESAGAEEEDAARGGDGRRDVSRTFEMDH